MFHNKSIKTNEDINNSSTVSINAETYIRPSSSLSSTSSSTLPSLIIEKMPNRHDDPIEFYDKLLEKAMKLYKKLFLTESIKSSDSTDFDNELHTHFETYEEHRTTDKNNSVSKDTATSANEGDDNNNNEQLLNEKGDELNVTEVNEGIENSASTSERASEMESVELMRVTTKMQSKYSGPFKNRISNIIENINIDITPQKLSIASEEGRNSHGDYILASSLFPIQMSPEIVDDFQRVIHSTPIRANSTSGSNNKRSSTSNKSSLSPEKRSKYHDIGTQTSEKNMPCNNKWETMKKFFIIGSDINIYKLCSCANHVCQ